MPGRHDESVSDSGSEELCVTPPNRQLELAVLGQLGGYRYGRLQPFVFNEWYTIAYGNPPVDNADDHRPRFRLRVLYYQSNSFSRYIVVECFVKVWNWWGYFGCGVIIASDRIDRYDDSAPDLSCPTVN